MAGPKAALFDSCCASSYRLQDEVFVAGFNSTVSAGLVCRCLGVSRRTCPQPAEDQPPDGVLPVDFIWWGARWHFQCTDRTRGLLYGGRVSVGPNLRGAIAPPNR